MNKELELWQFIADRLGRGENVMLLVVAKSSGSSPGRAGYKMAVGADGELCGSIGGGVMEVNLVEQSRVRLSELGAVAIGSSTAQLVEQVHQKNSPKASGMICSGSQTVILRPLTNTDLGTIDFAIDLLRSGTSPLMIISPDTFAVRPATCRVEEDPRSCFEKESRSDFTYSELLGLQDHLYIIGGGHCSLALSELMSKMDFSISVFDDRPELNTLEKNRFAHEIDIVDGYETIADLVPDGDNVYVVVMTLGYAFDEIVIRRLIEKDFKYFGVLGSKAKMKVLLKELRNDGFSADKLSSIHTPIGLPINSHTPEEIAVSIAAEIIAVKNNAAISPSRRA